MMLGGLALAILANRAGVVPRPRWCTFLVTWRCNARCGSCDSWQLEAGRELSPDEAGAALDQIGRFDVVRLSGGEPFLRPDLPALAAAIQRTSRPGVLHVTTNGSLPDRAVALAEGYQEPRRLRFLVSIDGMAAEHDRHRGGGATFERALETVRRLSELRRRGISVAVNHTIVSPASLADHASLRRKLGALGVDVQPVIAYAGSATYSAELQGRAASHLIPLRGYPLHPALAGANVVDFTIDALAAAAEIHDSLARMGKRYYLRGLLSRLRGDDRPSPRPRCVALRSHMRLAPDGGVPVCQFNGQRIGNLIEQPFEELWFGGAARSARRWVDTCPGCWAECEVIPNAVYTGDILRV